MNGVILKYSHGFRYEIGSDSPTTGIVVLLAAANMLSSVKANFKDGISNIMFAFLNGESFDYIGSSNMVYNMQKGEFPQSNSVGGTAKDNNTDGDNITDKKAEMKTWPKMDLSAINFVLELGQLNSQNSKLYTHVDSQFKNNELVDRLKEAAQNHGIDVNESSSSSRGLPPASLQSILKEKRDVPGILLSNFDQQYSNQFYHSPYDNFTLLNNYDYAKGENQPVVEHLAKGKLLVKPIYKTSHESI